MNKPNKKQNYSSYAGGVIPAESGNPGLLSVYWIPAYAGMTVE
jgi:hypothetical protein